MNYLYITSYPSHPGSVQDSTPTDPRCSMHLVNHFQPAERRSTPAVHLPSSTSTTASSPCSMNRATNCFQRNRRLPSQKEGKKEARVQEGARLRKSSRILVSQPRPASWTTRHRRRISLQANIVGTRRHRRDEAGGQPIREVTGERSVAGHTDSS